MDETLRRAMTHLLKQLEQGDQLIEDLLLIEVDWGAFTPGTTDDIVEVEFQGRRWPLVFTDSELVLRRTMCGASDGRAILACPAEAEPGKPQGLEIPLDLRARGHKRTPLRLGLRHRLYALTGHSWPPEVDYAGWRSSVERHLDALVTGANRIGLPNWNVTRTSLEQMLVKAAFDLTVEGHTGPQLLAALIPWQRRSVAPPAELELSLLRGQLRLHQVPGADAVLWAARQPGRAELLVRTGVMMGAEQWAQLMPNWGELNQLRALLVNERNVSEQEALAQVIALATETLHDLHHETRKSIVRDAERNLDKVLPEDSYNPWFPRALDGEIDRVARRLSLRDTEAIEKIAGLKEHLSAPQAGARLAVLDEMAALVPHWEAQRSQLDGLATVSQWATWYAQSGARLDLTALKLMARQHQGTGLNDPIQRLLDGYWRWRDKLNTAFAEAFLANYEAALHDRESSIFGVHRILDWVVHPLLERGKHVLLVVVDGMGWAAFHRLLDQWAEQNPPIYLRDPKAALALLPSITSVSRKGLFLSALPTDRLDSEEAYARKARTSETKALGRICRQYTSRLYNKTNLKGGDQVLDDLQFRRADLVAVILNTIDDDIKSTTTTVRLPRLEGLGPLVSMVHSALGAGWEVLVTADHGHTWHRDKRLRRGEIVPGGGERFAPLSTGETSPPGAIVTRDPDILRLQEGKRVALLTATGAYYGHGPRRGYHGGAALEEIVVPCAFLTDRPALDVTPTGAGAAEPAEEEAPHPGGYDLRSVVLTLPDGCVTSVNLPFTPSSREVKLLQALARMGEASEAELKHVLGTRRIAGPMSSLRDRLAGAGLDYIEYKGSGAGGAVYRLRTELLER